MKMEGHDGEDWDVCPLRALMLASGIALGVENRVRDDVHDGDDDVCDNMLELMTIESAE